MLKQLEAEGLTTGRTERQEGRPERRVYTLTDQGRDVLYQWLALPPVLQVERNELLLKCFFGAQTTPHINVEHIQGYRAGLLERIAILEQTEQTLKEQFRESRHLPYWLATTSYGLHAQRALVAWCDETLQRLQSLAQEH